MHDIKLELYDSNLGKKIPFEPNDRNQVKIYSCGPTVYNYSHLGNLRSYIFVDALRRTIKLFGYQPDQSMNITDIDDKIIRESISQNISIEEFTKPWTEKFFADLETLNIEKLEHYPKATESIDDMMHIIERLEDQGMTYEKDGNIYFSIGKFREYGSLSKIDTSGMISGARYDADEYEKENVRDFVLWKAPKEEGEKFWNTKKGKGRPGWHLECSAMIRKVYQSGVDIHTGGIDLLFPHHENEVAQSKGAYPKEEFVKYWLHCEHLLVEGQKMSKSKGNFYILSDIIGKGYNWKAIRYVLLSFHYRTKLNFSFDRLEEAKISIEKIQNTLNRLLELSFEKKIAIPEPLKSQSDFLNRIPVSVAKEAYHEMLKGLADDINSPKVLASVFENIKILNSKLDRDELSSEDILDYLLYFRAIDSFLGIFEFKRENQSSIAADQESYILSKIAERKKAKLDRDFKLADSIRDDLKSQGIILEDSKDGSVKWKIDK
ncbi:cysteine--tRNA ligase [Leptospira sp. GIMC2001]|uniref:cysteine--tRNA ligase n=1 Tax=Leptospira sp. GIMC2001 TaxID=1513297 RepID=UPI0023495E55|nr:cysteine--tRNA ligase [Leptospira sp. GIMC2001]WCL48014.1 cysteine--tRNA ligase [Leptospira sp. GIMC2001]